MYTNFFGFQSMPFRLSSSSGHYYLGSHYREVYQELFENIREGRRAVVLTGDAGVGKTTLIRQVMNNLMGMVRPVRVQRRHLDFESLIDEISHHLELGQNSGRVLSEKLTTLLNFLDEQRFPVVIVIDQADQMSEAALIDTLSLLTSNQQKQHPVQFVLTGLPDLEDKFYTACLRRLDQNDVHYACLEPLDSDEIEAYIDDCLQHAGGGAQGLFSPEAIERVAVYSKGFPLAINALCGGALLSASLEEQAIVNAEMIEEAAKHCQIPHVSTEAVQADVVLQDDEILQVLQDEPVSAQTLEVGHLAADEEGISLDEIGEDDLEAQFNHRTEIYEVDIDQKAPYGNVLAIASAIVLLLGVGFYLAFESSQLMSEQMASLHNAIELETEDSKLAKAKKAVIAPVDKHVKSPRQLPAAIHSVNPSKTEVFAAMESPQGKRSISTVDIDTPDRVDSNTSVLVVNRVEGLLLVADQQVAAKQLMTPEDDCAWKTYQTILEQEPSNVQALAGIGKIKDTYVRWARYEVRKDNVEHGRYLYGRALQVMPGDPTVLADLQRLNGEPSVGANQVSAPAVVQHATVENLQQTRLSRLYKRAEAQVTKRQLQTPKSNNAVKSYQEMLKLDPGNKSAVEGLERVKRIYVIWGESEMEKENWQRARMFFQRASALSPDDEYVLNHLDFLNQHHLH